MTKKWKKGTPTEFFGVAPDLAEVLRVKAALAVCLIRARRDSGLTQQRLAELIGSSQSRIAKMEAAEPSVSLELLIKASRAVGLSMEKIGAVVATGNPNAETVRRKSEMVVREG